MHETPRYPICICLFNMSARAAHQIEVIQKLPLLFLHIGALRSRFA